MAIKDTKEKVTAFRLTEEQWKAARTKLASEPPVGASTLGSMARKLVMDYTYDRLIWRNDAERLQSPELYGTKTEAIVPGRAAAKTKAKAKALAKAPGKAQASAVPA